MAETTICSASEYELMGRGLKTAKDMLADVKAGQPGTDPVLLLHNAEPFLEECIGWLARELDVCQVGDCAGFSVISESIEEAEASPKQIRVPCTPVEYGILIRGISSEEKKIAYSEKNGRPGTVIGDYAETGMKRIAYLKKELAVFFPVDGYCHPDGSTVVSLARGGDE